jgi:hypothetical protein
MAIIAIGYCIAPASSATAQSATDALPARPVTDSHPAPSTTDSLRQRQAADSLPARQHRTKHSHLDAGISYQNNDVYLGRKDSAPLPYFIPSMSYFHKSGLFATASLGYLKNSTTSRVDLFTLDIGYMFIKNKYDGMFTVSKYFYNSQSTSVTSGIKSSIACQNGYDFGPIKPSFTATLNIGDKVDFEGRLELSHTFSMANDNLDITPTIAAGGSTLHYYDSYHKRRYNITKKKKVVGTGIATVTGSVIDASKFQLLDYEPMMPIEYTIGKCTISFTPTFSIPVNPATIDLHTVKEDGTTTDRTKTEQIGNTFYFTAGISFLF